MNENKNGGVTISREEAMRQMGRWRALSGEERGQYMKDLKAHTFPMREFIRGLWGDLEYDCVRSYFGLKDDNVVTQFLVPVSFHQSGMYGRDIISRINKNGDEEDVDPINFTLPCPDTCDPNSPYYNLPTV